MVILRLRNCSPKDTIKRVKRPNKECMGVFSISTSNKHSYLEYKSKWDNSTGNKNRHLRNYPINVKQYSTSSSGKQKLKSKCNTFTHHENG